MTYILLACHHWFADSHQRPYYPGEIVECRDCDSERVVFRVAGPIRNVPEPVGE